MRQPCPELEARRARGALLLVRVDRAPGGDAALDWSEPAADATHDPPTSYDVYVSSAPSTGFGLLANVAAPTHVHVGGSAPEAYYLVNARNACGSSGEEPF